MAAALYDEVVTVVPACTLTVVRDTDTTQVSGPRKVMRRAGSRPFGGDPLIDGAALLLAIPLRHVYAALWRVGVLDVRA